VVVKKEKKNAADLARRNRIRDQVTANVAHVETVGAVATPNDV
jgi:hypothetical protein